MSAKVIQGSFLSGQPKLAAFVRPRIVSPPPIQAKSVTRPPGPPVPAFAARSEPPTSAFAERPPAPPVRAYTARPAAVQRHGAAGTFPVEAAQLGLASGGGRPLPDSVRGKMEAALGADFADVRVHVGPQAERIGAIAFTVGSDIYFAPGRFLPDTMHGQQLLGHELAHVVQQRAGRVRNPLGSGLAIVQDHALEAEADRLGHRAANHRVGVQAKMAPGAMQPSSPVRISPPVSAGPGSYRLTAGAGGRQVGSVMVHARDKGVVEVTDLGVDQTQRGHGIGQMLVASAAKTGLQFGKSKVTLAAQDKGSGHLTRWYKEMGFTQTGVNQRGYPQLEAPISRVLAGSAQRKVAWRSPGTLQAMKPAPKKMAPKEPPPSLKDLAKPQLFALPQTQIAAQNKIATNLNEVIERNILGHHNIFGLGTIELPRFSKTTPVLKDADDLPAHLQPLSANTPVKLDLDDEMKGAIVQNVMATLVMAGQIAYLTSRGLPNEEWAILIEVHYYYDRPQDSIRLHKDTLGDTLFLTLNYLSDQETAGPEFILNPDPVEAHEKYIAGRYPQNILEDFSLARKKLPQPTTIGATKIPAKGVIALVDELNYHATPFIGRRTVTGNEVNKFMKEKNLKSTWYAFHPEWRYNMDEIRRSELRGVDGKVLTVVEIEEFFEKFEETRDIRGKASIAKGRDPTEFDIKQLEPPIRGQGRPALTRTMSSWAREHKLPKPLPKGVKRQFFRTWVRVVRRERREDFANPQG
jgi:ribosomal protein S18 acetylase RimI-like enzyme